jgi:hypothetical protein
LRPDTGDYLVLGNISDQLNFNFVFQRIFLSITFASSKYSQIVATSKRFFSNLGYAVRYCYTRQAGATIESIISDACII